MTKELYNELLKEGLITKPYMTLDYINNHKLGLKDIITIPAILEMLIQNNVTEQTAVEETVVEETVVETIEETVVEETVVETIEETIEETVEETKEEIVVDEPEVEKKPKAKKN